MALIQQAAAAKIEERMRQMHHRPSVPFGSRICCVAEIQHCSSQAIFCKANPCAHRKPKDASTEVCAQPRRSHWNMTGFKCLQTVSRLAFQTTNKTATFTSQKPCTVQLTLLHSATGSGCREQYLRVCPTPPNPQMPRNEWMQRPAPWRNISCPSSFRSRIWTWATWPRAMPC